MAEFFEKNRKFKMAILAGIVAFVGALMDMTSEQIMTSISPFLTFIGFQGIADIGKEKAKIETAGEE